MLADPEDEDCSVEYEGLFINIRKVYEQSITRCMFQFLKRNWNVPLVLWYWFTGTHFLQTDPTCFEFQQLDQFTICISLWHLRSHGNKPPSDRSNNFMFLRLKIYWNRQVFGLIGTLEIWMKPEMLHQQASSSKF